MEERGRADAPPLESAATYKGTADVTLQNFRGQVREGREFTLGTLGALDQKPGGGMQEASYWFPRSLYLPDTVTMFSSP